MQLELKESNSPFWLLGLSKGKSTVGSATNIPCYHKTLKKQKELASNIINEPGIDEVYCITGVEWDNMKGSWSAKEAGSYIQNKGRLILSKDEIVENKYPKGVSRDPLPKNGVKTYTSVATALEDNEGDKKMKLELNKNIVKEDIDNIPEILQDRFFMVMADGRPEKFKEFTKEELSQFAEFVKELPEQEVTELERSLLLFAISMAHGDDLTVDTVTESNQFTTEFTMGDTVKTICPNGDLSDETAMIVGYDDDGFYKVKWSNGEVSEGLHDKNLELVCKSELKESKIVTPVGNPQTAGSFVNIDVDLDHMEVSDFIVRLAQAIRSEQTSVLEYVALRSANGITNEERANIDAIIEEEKNHMVAITTMLYKQLLTNHKQNVDAAGAEFTLPTFGMEIFDNSKDGKLTESIQLVVEKLALKEARDASNDEYYVGDEDSGYTYYGIDNALSAVKFHVTKFPTQCVVVNNTLADSFKNENIKLEDTFNTIDELINELKTDTNYDEIALHIHDYAKTNKARASELMDKLFELEKSKSPKECRDALIADLEQENKQYKTEDIKVSFDGETMSQEQWDVVVDVNYDADFQTQVVNNLTNAIKSMNSETYSSEHYGIAEDKYTLAGDKFNFVILTFAGFNKTVDKAFVEDVCNKLFKKATTYEYFIELA